MLGTGSSFLLHDFLYLTLLLKTKMGICDPLVVNNYWMCIPVGYIYLLVVYTYWLYIYVGCIFLSVLQTHWLFVPIGYIYPFFVPSNDVFQNDSVVTLKNRITDVKGRLKFFSVHIMHVYQFYK